MQSFNLAIVITLVQSIILVLPTPVTSSSIIARTRYCANAPHTVAGTMLHARGRTSARLGTPGPALGPRYQFNTVVWCGEDSDTYVMVRLVGAVVGPAVSDLLSQVYLEIVSNAYARGEYALIPHGSFTHTGPENLVFTAVNSNNHQITWGVLGEAIEALVSYMNTAGFGRVFFTIYDGINEVASGSIEG